VTYQTVGRLHSSAEEDFFGVETHGRCTQIAVFKRLPGAKGPYDGELECFDELNLELVKNFKFPSKVQIDNLKISCECSSWDDDDFEEYEYSEDNTNLDEVDPEWWQAVWNNEVEDEKDGMGNGQGWNDDNKSVLHCFEDESVLHCWKSKDFWIEEFKSEPKSSDIPVPDKVCTNEEELKEWHCKVPWSKVKSIYDGCRWVRSPCSSRLQSDDDKARSEEGFAILSNFANKNQYTQVESCSHNDPVHVKKPREWMLDMESKAKERGEIKLHSPKFVAQTVLGAPKFQNSGRS